MRSLAVASLDACLAMLLRDKQPLSVGIESVVGLRSVRTTVASAAGLVQARVGQNITFYSIC